MKTETHKFRSGFCKHCGIIEKYAEGENCEPEDLEIWCASTQTLLQAIKHASENEIT